MSVAIALVSSTFPSGSTRRTRLWGRHGQGRRQRELGQTWERELREAGQLGLEVDTFDREATVGEPQRTAPRQVDQQLPDVGQEERAVAVDLRSSTGPASRMPLSSIDST